MRIPLGDAGLGHRLADSRAFTLISKDHGGTHALLRSPEGAVWYISAHSVWVPLGLTPSFPKAKIPPLCNAESRPGVNLSASPSQT